MATRSWLRAHRRQLMTHTFIIVGFVLFTIFVPEPIFDRLESIPGESRLYHFSLPAETKDISFHVEHISAEGCISVDMRGWAFVNDHDSENTTVYVVLKSPGQTYIFDTEVEERLDVTRNFEELGLNLDYSGFTALIPGRKIANGEYAVGIYIAKDGIQALQYMNRTIRKSGDTIGTE
jgi:hypothetical protein